MQIDVKNREFLLSLARESIACAVARSPMAERPVPEWAASPQGAFVTIKSGGELRGCIGRMTAQDSLYRTVIEMARAAALEDPRFPPLSLAELDAVKIEISALSPLRPIEDTALIEVGKHGIYITSGFHSGVLLPQVATEWGWDRATFLRQTFRKAGLPESAERDPSTRIYVFEAVVFGED